MYNLLVLPQTLAFTVDPNNFFTSYCPSIHYHYYIFPKTFSPRNIITGGPRSPWFGEEDPPEVRILITGGPRSPWFGEEDPPEDRG